MTVITAVVVWRDKTLPPLTIELDIPLTNSFNGVTTLSGKAGQNFHIPIDQYRLITIQYSKRELDGQPASS